MDLVRTQNPVAVEKSRGVGAGGPHRDIKLLVIVGPSSGIEALENQILEDPEFSVIRTGSFLELVMRSGLEAKELEDQREVILSGELRTVDGQELRDLRNKKEDFANFIDLDLERVWCKRERDGKMVELRDLRLEFVLYIGKHWPEACRRAQIVGNVGGTENLEEGKNIDQLLRNIGYVYPELRECFVNPARGSGWEFLPGKNDCVILPKES